MKKNSIIAIMIIAATVLVSGCGAKTSLPDETANDSNKQSKTVIEDTQPETKDSDVQNNEKNVHSYDYSKILSGDLSDFVGLWMNGNGDRIDLKADGTEGQTTIKESDGKIYGQVASDFTKRDDGSYIWGVNFDYYDQENGSYDLFLYPVGVDINVPGYGKVPSDTTQVRMYGGQAGDPTSPEQIYYHYVQR